MSVFCALIHAVLYLEIILDGLQKLYSVHICSSTDEKMESTSLALVGHTALNGAHATNKAHSHILIVLPSCYISLLYDGYLDRHHTGFISYHLYCNVVECCY